MKISVKIDVIQGICDVLKHQFPDVAVHDEPFKQGANGPCFFVHQLKAVYTPDGGNFMRTDYMLMVMYQPKVGQTHLEIRQMSRELVKLFKFCETLKLHPTAMICQVEDGVLQVQLDFSVRYSLATVASPLFEQLEVRSDVRGG